MFMSVQNVWWIQLVSLTLLCQSFPQPEWARSISWSAIIIIWNQPLKRAWCQKINMEGILLLYLLVSCCMWGVMVALEIGTWGFFLFWLPHSFHCSFVLRSQAQQNSEIENHILLSSHLSVPIQNWYLDTSSNKRELHRRASPYALPGNTILSEKSGFGHHSGVYYWQAMLIWGTKKWSFKVGLQSCSCDRGASAMPKKRNIYVFKVRSLHCCLHRESPSQLLTANSKVYEE